MRRNILKKDKKGALEGLPLYLIILVVIAGVGTVILVGWMMSARTNELDYIELNVSAITTLRQDPITVTAYDQNGRALRGVTVTAVGCGINYAGETNSNGVVSIPVKGSLTVPPGQPSAPIEITATYTGGMRVTRTAMVTVRA